jgi:galactokinase
MKSVAAHFGKTHLRGITKEELIAAAPELRKTTGDRALMRAFHFVCENERVEGLSKALDEGNLEAFFAGIKASGNSSYKYLQNVFTVKNVSEQGISLATMFAESFLASCTRPCACRVHGGGFAGTIQAFVPTENAADFEAYMNGIFGEGACHILRIRGEGAYTLV